MMGIILTCLCKSSNLAIGPVMLKKYMSSRMPSNIRKSLGLDYVHRSNSNLRANWVLQVFNDVSDMLHVFRSKLF